VADDALATSDKAKTLTYAGGMKSGGWPILVAVLFACGSTTSTGFVPTDASDERGVVVDASRAFDASGESDATLTDGGELPDAASETSTDAPADGIACKPATCITGAGWNCDPACGTVDPLCASATCAENGPSVALVPGVYQLRTPPVTTQQGQCGAACGSTGPWWAWRFRLPADQPGCVVVEGPNFMTFASNYVAVGAPFSLCGSQPVYGCGSNGFSTSTPHDLYLVIGVPRDTPGALFHIEFRQSASCTTACNIPAQGCNGSGG
jgi:hypothetical protein